MTYIFTFSINPETKEAAFAGNVSVQEAAIILQNLAVQEAVQRAKERDNGQGTDKGKVELPTKQD